MDKHSQVKGYGTTATSLVMYHGKFPENVSTSYRTVAAQWNSGSKITYIVSRDERDNTLTALTAICKLVTFRMSTLFIVT